MANRDTFVAVPERDRSSRSWKTKAALTLGLGTSLGLCALTDPASAQVTDDEAPETLDDFSSGNQVTPEERAAFTSALESTDFSGEETLLEFSDESITFTGEAEPSGFEVVRDLPDSVETYRADEQSVSFESPDSEGSVRVWAGPDEWSFEDGPISFHVGNTHDDAHFKAEVEAGPLGLSGDAEGKVQISAFDFFGDRSIAMRDGENIYELRVDQDRHFSDQRVASFLVNGQNMSEVADPDVVAWRRVTDDGHVLTHDGETLTAEIGDDTTFKSELSEDKYNLDLRYGDNTEAGVRSQGSVSIWQFKNDEVPSFSSYTPTQDGSVEHRYQDRHHWTSNNDSGIAPKTLRLSNDDTKEKITVTDRKNFLTLDKGRVWYGQEDLGLSVWAGDEPGVGKATYKFLDHRYDGIVETNDSEFVFGEQRSVGLW